MTTTPASLPAEAPAPSAGALMTVTGLTKHFPVNRGIIFRHRVGLVRSVDDVSFEVARARPWASWANPAAARPRPPGCWCG